MNRKIALGTSIGAGALLWGLSPAITGHLEPWDGHLALLPTGLAVFSLLFGFVFPKDPFPSSIGLLIGQLVYAAIMLPVGPLILVGIAFLVGHILVFSLPFTFLGAWIHRRWKPKGFNRQLS